jgi:hypothetical protein
MGEDLPGSTLGAVRKTYELERLHPFAPEVLGELGDGTNLRIPRPRCCRVASRERAETSTWQELPPVAERAVGLRKLVEHIWKVVGIARTCLTMDELRREMQRLYGENAAFQFAVKIVRKSESSGQGLLFDPKEILD